MSGVTRLGEELELDGDTEESSSEEDGSLESDLVDYFNLTEDLTEDLKGKLLKFSDDLMILKSCLEGGCEKNETWFLNLAKSIYSLKWRSGLRWGKCAF